MAASWLSGWNPISAFPAYHGTYDVGTIDVELPVSELPAPAATPEDAPPTIAFRIFYPCPKPSKSEHDRPVRWIPQPQRLTAAALLKFLGLSERAAGFTSHLTRQLYWIKINAYRNARLLNPSNENGRWPVAFFSHGLAGSRNAYSYVCGDLASNGLVVIAMDHRDGSSPVQYVRKTKYTTEEVIEAKKISHTALDEVFEARDKQLRIRLWEMSMAYEALMKIDAGQHVENLDENTSHHRHERVEVLKRFEKKLDIHEPSKVSWVGHSFGAATIVQLLKSVYYAPDRRQDAGKPLIIPNNDAAIAKQITVDSPTMLLDLWCLPLQSPSQAFLSQRPLPSYAEGGPQGDHVLAVLSEGFHNWDKNLQITKRTVAAPSGTQRISAVHDKARTRPALARLRDESPSADSGYESHDSRSQPPSPRSDRHSSSEHGPHMFFVEHSQHFNQSDFGVLFPWLTRRFAKAEEPERILELNTRAMTQVIRNAGIAIAGTDDHDILQKDASIRSWKSIPVGGDKVEDSHALTRELTRTGSNPPDAPIDRITSAKIGSDQLEL